MATHRSIRAPALAVALTMATTLAGAQVPAAFQGDWKVVWQVKGSGQEFNSKLVLREDGGSWQTFNATSKSDACQGRAVAVAVASAASDAVTLKLKFSDITSGCNDVTLKLRTEGGAVTGTRSGQPVTLSRP